jgi:lipid II:glycine glycyltransferase (peptidoglycan interpeptide bridge formation enzyme)
MARATRRAIRKAERSGIRVRSLEGEAGLAGFVRLHQRLRKRKFRLLAQPPAFFAALAAHFEAVAGWHPLGAFLDDRLLAASIFLRWGDVLYYKFNASDPEALALRPNNLLIWAGMQLAHALGCRVLDLGPSDLDQPGLIRFKQGFGAAERDLRFLRWTPPGALAHEDPAPRRALGELARMFTAPEVPDELSGRAGATLYRFFA